MNFTTQMVSPPNRIAIIGAGSVGADIAFALLLGRVAAEIVLVDIDTARCHAQVQDLSDGAFLSSTRVREGSFRDASQCDIIVISAGAKQRPGESKTDLVGRNLDILRAVINDMKPLRQDAILLIVANPVDTLTFFAQCMSGLPKGQVIGTGTSLDTARLRILLAEEIQVSDKSVHAYVLGEHGDSQFVAWSSAAIGGVHIQTVFPLTHDRRQIIAAAVKEKAYEIIKAKGATSFGIAAVVSILCESILFDRRQVRPVSFWQDSLGCCLSMPAVIGRQGVLSTIAVPLDGEEREALELSAQKIKEVIESISSIESMEGNAPGYYGAQIYDGQPR